MAITLTKEAIQKANTYVPLAVKTAISQKLAPECIDKTKIAVKKGDKNLTPMPDRYTESLIRKARMLMGIFIHYYLQEPVEDENLCLSIEEYDKWGSSHIFNQLERLKRSSDVCDKVFDIISDYKNLEKMLNAEIYMLLQLRNDPCDRIMSMIDMQTTPENLQNALAGMTEIRQQFENQIEGMKNGNN